ncbi:MAG: D-alanyl-D-alanine carboxypeptidase [Nisaea sp.]|jgi:D-alanyl-D-alanine carboxypeptidase (penicillin-binding protein 5/6)|uniref:D-alanyl-D-alanine carboxypeptidase family protein n=1 Tax=Nisaea sp. TaxID=2024842 RepID=UPI001B139B90|nr:D-alanyl-D-alanine carboxypeptidase family protein [Nisaea sp.]MBO6559008.1 D-alanyl-D-alanine carboxypeptidase [Nisaea sp.]
MTFASNLNAAIRRAARVLPAALLLLTVQISASEALDTSAREAFLIDFDTGAVLFEKDSEKPMPPASMTKIMTAFMAFERLKDGRLSMDDTIAISEKAWRKGGSKMFVKVNTRVPISDILRGIIVQSGNDASIALAEALAGTEEAFAEEMTRRGREIGLTNSTFKNATGWPDPEHRSTARDLAFLAMEIIRRFPEYYPIYSETTFTYNNIKQGNRNPLLYKNMGADGLKTGHTEAAGYGLTASAIRNGRRLVLVVNGLESVKDRSRESEALLDWGFREFENYQLFTAGQTVADADVWLGNAKTVALTTDRNVLLTIPRTSRPKMKVSVVYEGPIPAPITAGTQLATLRVTAPEMEDVNIPLFAAADVEQLGVFGKVGAAVQYLVWGSGG